MGGLVYSKEQVFVSDFPIGGRFLGSISIQENNTKGFYKVRVLRNNKRLLFPSNMTFFKKELHNPNIGDEYYGEFIVKQTKKGLYYLELFGDDLDLTYPKTKKEIVKYLKNNFKGIGEKTAENILKVLGMDCLSKISEDSDILDNQDLKLSKNNKEVLRNGLVDGKLINTLIARFTYFGVDEKRAFEFYQHFGSKSLEILDTNPWSLCDISPFFFKKSEEIFQDKIINNSEKVKYKKLLKFRNRYRAAIKYYLKNEVENTGSLCEEESVLFNAFNNGFIEKHSVFQNIKGNIPEAKVLKDVLADLVEEGDVIKKNNKKREVVYYLKDAFVAEQLVIKSIRKFNRSVSRVVNEDVAINFIKNYEDKFGVKLAEKQKKAIDLLPNNKISILTGGPGTGKTSTLKVIKEYIKFLKKEKYIDSDEICLLAPTGKAARRMNEVLQINSSTIHRKLKIQGFGKESIIEKINDRFVIVDESSMMDVYLFSQLLNSLSDNTNLLLVGDENQLPSVGPGLILRDLISSQKVKTVKLNEVFRQGKDSPLIYNSNLLQQGITIDSGQYKFDKTFSVLKDSYFVKANTFEIQNRLVSVLDYLYKKNIEQKNILILSGQKNGILGVNTLNQLIQQKVNKNIKNQNISIIRKFDTTIFSVGDPVIQTINDYEFEVFNGEIGEVVDVEYDSSGNKILVVNFPDDLLDFKTVRYFGSKILNLELAYCITYHKSQGSECPYVIQIIDSSQEKVINRSLIYTGYTRTKKTNFIIGNEESFNIAILNTDNLKRKSLIKEKL